MKKKLFLLLVVVTECVTAVSAQGRRGLRINEVMVVNDSSVVDDFGQRHAWVELYNSTFAPLEISSVFLTNDKDNNKKYPVPLGDVNTEIPARQHVLFWADGQPNKGTFHMNFTLTPGEDNYIAIYDANGLSLIDEVVVPASLKPGQSYARKVDGEGGTDADAWEVRDGSGQYYITPSSNNVIKDTNGKVEMFAEQDENGFGMAVMAMGVVFTALLLLSLCFYIISKIGEGVSRKNKVKTVTAHLDEVHDSHKDHDSGEAIAAIVMALHEHLDAHDRESTVLTINKVRRAYSPWNSKIYSLRELPRR